MSTRIAISIGDYNGIGPEVVLKTLYYNTLKDITPIILSSDSVISYYSERLNLSLPFHFMDTSDDIKTHKVNILESYNGNEVTVNPGKLSKEGGKHAMLSVEKGIELCKTRQADAMVTAPISKEAVNLAGYHIPGHTEFLAEKTHTTEYMMMLVNDNLRVGLATIHVPLSEVTGLLSEHAILNAIRMMHRTLANDFCIQRPRIAVLGLNPHAGDGGIIGKEEIDIISPALQKAGSGGMDVSGPHPADGFFGNRKQTEYDGILAMYHDQGLIPFKTLSFGAGVNFTAGLPIIRTSPDHGTAFGIAGKNEANPSSFSQAFQLAAILARNREKQTA